MTKRDFQLIADVVHFALITNKDRSTLAVDFAAKMATVNPRFDQEKFIEACLKVRD